MKKMVSRVDISRIMDVGGRTNLYRVVIVTHSYHYITPRTQRFYETVLQGRSEGLIARNRIVPFVNFQRRCRTRANGSVNTILSRRSPRWRQSGFRVHRGASLRTRFAERACIPRCSCNARDRDPTGREHRVYADGGESVWPRRRKGGERVNEIKKKKKSGGPS